MPCGDISEQISLRLDDADQLVTYQLNKRTCGTEIGSASLLLPALVRRSASAILTLTPDDVLGSFDAVPGDMEFLYAKHLMALQEALRALGGLPAAPGMVCTAVTITAEPDALLFEGLIQGRDDRAKVKSCGGCGDCGAKRPKPPEAAADS